MTTEVASSTSPDTAPAPRRPTPWVALTFGVLVVVALAVVAINARHGAVAARIKNPGVTGAPRPVQPLFGFHHWLALHQIGTIVMMVALVVGFVVAWRRKPGHPILLMVIVMTLLIWQDPIMNWAPYAVYNPQLWHWPETWGLVSMSPSVEPFIVVGYAMFYMLPFFPAVWILRKVQARRPVESFAWRHPLISLSVLIFAIGFVFDAFLEIFLVRTQLYIYSQVIPFGSFAVGKWYQFPLIWESALVTVIMIPAGVLLYKDDTGRTQAEKLARRIRFFRTRPVFGTFVVMFVIINAAYFFLYGGGYALIRWTHTATSVACPYPFPEAKTYDPNGFYAKAGQPGPYYPGLWSGWESAQLHGRPHVNATAEGGRCSSG
jgi:Spirocyclase AveC-like